MTATLTGRSTSRRRRDTGDAARAGTSVAERHFGRLLAALAAIAFASRRFAAIPGFPGVLALLEEQAGAHGAGDASDSG